MRGFLSRVDQEVYFLINGGNVKGFLHKIHLPVFKIAVIISPTSARAEAIGEAERGSTVYSEGYRR